MLIDNSEAFVDSLVFIQGLLKILDANPGVVACDFNPNTLGRQVQADLCEFVASGLQSSRTSRAIHRTPVLKKRTNRGLERWLTS
jgi:hypothetical protein